MKSSCELTRKRLSLQVVVGHHPKFNEFRFSISCVRMNRAERSLSEHSTPEGQFHLNNRLNELSMEAKGGKV